MRITRRPIRQNRSPSTLVADEDPAMQHRGPHFAFEARTEDHLFQAVITEEEMLRALLRMRAGILAHRLTPEQFGQWAKLSKLALTPRDAPEDV